MNAEAREPHATKEGPMTSMAQRLSSGMLDESTRWRAVLAHARRADGLFVYAVRSTGVYCRPSCASRRPRRDRVAFFASAADAERSGYRACRRCRPNELAPPDRWMEKIRRACVYLANV